MTGSHEKLASAAAAFAIALAAAGCNEGSPASPAVAGDADNEGDAGSEVVDAGPAVCVPGIDASFTSILTKILATPSCGTNLAGNCHSQSGASPSGTGNLLDYSLDASAVYAELLGDGGGHPSTNLSGDAGRIPRVAPFDSDASMLYIKLTLTTHDNPYYGAGMPLPAPGSVCPATLEAVKTWIDQGATSN